MQSNLPMPSQPWGRWVEETTDELEFQAESLSVSKGANVTVVQERLNEISARLAVVQAEFRNTQQSMATNAESLQYVTAALDSMSSASANTKYAANTSVFALSNGWYAGSLPSVTINSPYPRVLVTFGGKGTQAPRLAFSAPGYPRGTVVNDANMGLWLSFGLNFPGSAERNVLINVTPNTNVTIQMHVLLDDPMGLGLGSMEGCYIQAEPVP